jgi:hypothetical protein
LCRTTQNLSDDKNGFLSSDTLCLVRPKFLVSCKCHLYESFCQLELSGAPVTDERMTFHLLQRPASTGAAAIVQVSI